MAGVVASKVRRARVKSLIDKEDQIRKASIAIIPNPAQESKILILFKDVKVSKPNALCTLGKNLNHY